MFYIIHLVCNKEWLETLLSDKKECHPLVEMISFYTSNNIKITRVHVMSIP